MSARREPPDQTRNFLRTLEIIYASTAVVLGGALAAFGPALFRRWVDNVTLSTETVEQAAFILAFVVVCRWPFGLYSGALGGRQKFVVLNLVNGTASTLRGGGAVLVLLLIAPTIQAFLVWQVFVSLLQTGSMAILTWRELKTAEDVGRPRFKRDVVLRIWRFSAGIAATSALGLTLVQMDKLILSRMLPLNEFGYYSLAWSISSVLLLVVTPIAAGLFPRFCEQLAAGDRLEATRLYHESCQFVTAVSAPLAMLLVFFSYEIVKTWSGDSDLALKSHVAASLLAAGSFLNVLLGIPCRFQLATGRTGVWVFTNIVAAIVCIPSLIVLADLFGTAGGGLSWILVNTVYVLLGSALIHKGTLDGNFQSWCINDVALPTFAAVIPMAATRILMPQNTPTYGILLCFVGALSLSSLFAVLAAPALRGRVWRLARSMMKNKDNGKNDKDIEIGGGGLVRTENPNSGTLSLD